MDGLELICCHGRLVSVLYRSAQLGVNQDWLDFFSMFTGFAVETTIVSR